jgi:hypothetical protein
MIFSEISVVAYERSDLNIEIQGRKLNDFVSSLAEK